MVALPAALFSKATIEAPGMMPFPIYINIGGMIEMSSVFGGLYYVDLRINMLSLWKQIGLRY